MKLPTTKIRLALLLIFVLFAWGKAQYEIPQRPSSDQSLIFDYGTTQILTATEKEELNQKLIAYEGKTSTQIALIIIESLQGEDINLLAAEWGHKWGIGQEGKENGLVFLLSIKDREIAIQNGYGLEEYMTDAMSRRVIANYMIPEFKQGNYYRGFDDGINAVINILQGKFVEDGTESNTGVDFFTIMLFLGLFFLLLILLSRNKGGGNNGGRGHRSGRDIIFTDYGRTTWFPRSGGGFSGGGSFGGGSGGFGGFGGGGFGGGGASGSW